MTAAHAYEYEIPERAPAPIEAVEQAEGGKVVYLTRSGRRIAAVVPHTVAEQNDLDDPESFWEAQRDLVRAVCRRMWRTVEGEDECTRQAMREPIERTLEQIQDAADVAVASAVARRRARSR